MDVPCCRSLCVSFLVLNTNQWDANSIKDAIISFSILEDVADRVFSKLEKDIESVSTRLNGLQTVILIRSVSTCRGSIPPQTRSKT